LRKSAEIGTAFTKRAIERQKYARFDSYVSKNMFQIGRIG
jgi:hypothetical protein